MAYVDSTGEGKGEEQMPQMQENFEIIRNVFAVRVKPEKQEEASPLLIDLINFSVLKKETSDRKENIADASTKKDGEEFEASTSESGKKVLFPEYKFHFISVFH